MLSGCSPCFIMNIHLYRNVLFLLYILKLYLLYIHYMYIYNLPVQIRLHY